MEVFLAQAQGATETLWDSMQRLAMYLQDSQDNAVQCPLSHGLECAVFDISQQEGDG